MIPFILTLLASLIGGTAFLAYKHPKYGAKICSIGWWICLSILMLIKIFQFGYQYAALQYFKLDLKNENFETVKNLNSDNIITTTIIIAITCVCFFTIWVLSMTVFRNIINDDVNNHAK